MNLPETRRGYNKIVWLNDAEQVYVQWPPDVTIKQFGEKGTEVCWDNLQIEAQELMVTLILRTSDNRSPSDKKHKVQEGTRPLHTKKHFTILRIVGPVGLTLHWYKRLRNIMIKKMVVRLLDS